MLFTQTLPYIYECRVCIAPHIQTGKLHIKEPYFWTLRLDAQDTRKRSYEKGGGRPSPESVATSHRNHMKNNTITKKALKQTNTR